MSELAVTRPVSFKTTSRFLGANRSAESRALEQLRAPGLVEVHQSGKSTLPVTLLTSSDRP
jgi:CRP-like cAMP-binding protein